MMITDEDYCFQDVRFTPKNAEEEQAYIDYWINPRSGVVEWYKDFMRDRAFQAARDYHRAYVELFDELRVYARRNGWAHEELDRWQMKLTLPDRKEQFYALNEGYIYQIRGSGDVLSTRAMIRTWFHLDGDFHDHPTIMQIASVLHGELGYRIKLENTGDRWADVVLVDVFNKTGENYHIDYRQNAVFSVSDGSATHTVWVGPEQGHPGTTQDHVHEALRWVQLRQQEQLG